MGDNVASDSRLEALSRSLPDRRASCENGSWRQALKPSLEGLRVSLQWLQLVQQRPRASSLVFTIDNVVLRFFYHWQGRGGTAYDGASEHRSPPRGHRLRRLSAVFPLFARAGAEAVTRKSTSEMLILYRSSSREFEIIIFRESRVWRLS